MPKDRIYKYAPLWGSWEITEKLGSGSFGDVYKVEKDILGEKIYSAVKIITIPTKEQYEGLISYQSNISKDAAKTYFQDFVHDITNEVKLLYQFRGNSNIISYEDYELIEDKESILWDLLIRMEYSKPLKVHLKNASIARRDIVKIGIDIACALQLCHENGIIHRDIKEENIFVSKSGSYKLGDFGIARKIMEGTKTGTRVGTLSCIPPEVFNGKEYDNRADIYSLGLMLYRLMNHGNAPFVNDTSEPLMPQDIEKAQLRRLSGEEFPLISSWGELGQVVKKACSFDPADRYQSVLELKASLESKSILETDLTQVDTDQLPSTHQPQYEYNETGDLKDNPTIFLFGNQASTALLEPESNQTQVHILDRPSINKKKLLGITLVAFVTIPTIIMLSLNYLNPVGNQPTTKPTNLVVNNTSTPTELASNIHNTSNNSTANITNMPSSSPKPSNSGKTTNVVPSQSIPGTPITNENTSTISASSSPVKTPQPQIVNLLKNSNAEIPSSIWVGSSWLGSAGAFEYSTEVKYEGKQSLKISKSNNTARHYFYQSADTIPGKSYILSGYIRTVEVSSQNNKGAKIWANYWKTSGILYAEASTACISQNTEWKRVEARMNIPMDAAPGVTVYVGIDSETGTAFFDAISLVQID